MYKILSHYVVHLNYTTIKINNFISSHHIISDNINEMFIIVIACTLSH